APPPADASDPAGLKVEKNALALVFIPAIMSVTEEFIADRPGVVFNVLMGQLGTVKIEDARAGIDPRNPQGSICAHVYSSLFAVFKHIATAYVITVVDAAEMGDAQMAWTVDNLLTRYQRALSEYCEHTDYSDQHFTPHGHVMAGINTALFLILRALSGIMVLGEAKLGRPFTRAELATTVKNTQPLLLTIARCHLEQLLELEGPLGKQEDLFMTLLDSTAYAEALSAMFVMAESAEGMRLEIRPEVLAGLPVMTGEKPRTGCPALYASTFDNVNAIVALVRLTERTFADLSFGE
ncbi:MAG: hypothetical protein H7Y60_01035, partial [Rhodospirillaceae bacterium]|nr:hypothetical protein [Rhodospirillales bacterium]